MHITLFWTGLKDGVLDELENNYGHSQRECCLALLERWKEEGGNVATRDSLIQAIQAVQLPDVAGKGWAWLPMGS